MSATIPENMLLSDLLKATGYNGPSELQGLTFTEATVGESELQTKEVTIVTNTSTEVIPDTGKLLSKVTVVTAVPDAPNELYAYGTTGKSDTVECVVFLKAIPSEDTAEVAVYVPSAVGLTAGTGSYTKETDTVTVSDTTYARYTTGDFTI